jgi:glycosyltransferase involved in cell wall biosynthesis
MKVLMISGDKNMLNPETDAAKRLALQRGAVETLDVFVWPHVHTKWQIWRALRENKYDVITSQDPFWRGLFALKLGWLTDTRVNIQVHADLNGQSFLRHILAQIVLRHANSIRVVSEKIRQQVSKIAPRIKTTVLPVYIDIPAFSSVIRRNHVSKNILWMGRYEDEKDPLAAVEVLKEVLKGVPDARLIMIGDGTLRELLAKAAAGLPVTVAHWQNPILFLDTADVVLSTSKHESWGAVFVEALAAGVPVVAPDVGVAREAGAIVVPREKLAEAVIEVLKSGLRGELKLKLLSASEWAIAWRNSL